jgi:hypothetical protein
LERDLEELRTIFRSVPEMIQILCLQFAAESVYKIKIRSFGYVPALIDDLEIDEIARPVFVVDKKNILFIVALSSRGR